MNENKINKNKIITLAGNPNVGKSTVFNKLTGMNQHTGNWAGKTVSSAKGYFKYNNENYTIIDIPGTYSLMSQSKDEEVARDFICFEDTYKIVIVCDAISLERNLALVLQTLETRKNIVLCINLLDEAKKKKISIDIDKLKEILGIEVVYISARKNVDKLLEKINIKEETKQVYSFFYEEHIEIAISIIEEAIKDINLKRLNSRWIALKILENNEKIIDKLEKYLKINLKGEKILKSRESAKSYLSQFNIDDKIFLEKIIETIYKNCGEIVEKTVTYGNEDYYKKDMKIDKILTSKKAGIPIMILLLSLIFWITIVGANYPSTFLANNFNKLENNLRDWLYLLNISPILISILLDGIYKVVAFVVSVMLPPMAIFFPLFTILEDLGYLPRVAFNMDNIFKKCDACGKQALTMAMGFGCNACGITGCRIIDSKREKLIAIITNNFVPCNGRFPTLIAIITMFFLGSMVGFAKSLLSAVFLTGVIFLGVLMTFIISKILSKTILKGESTSYTLELPPYRKPQIIKTITRSIFDKTIVILGRAIAVSIPAGLVIWVMANFDISGQSILLYITNFLEPFAKTMGLDGVILMGFILGFPANEIVLPIIIMGYMGTTSIMDIGELSMVRDILINNGWTINTAICVIIFSLFHWPCSTALITIKKETRSNKWTFLAFIIPTIVGIIMCMLITGFNFIF